MAINQEDIRSLWADNFPKRKSRPSHMSVCVELFHIAQSTAQELFVDSNDADVRLRHALRILGIPDVEFDKFKKEWEREL